MDAEFRHASPDDIVITLSLKATRKEWKTFQRSIHSQLARANPGAVREPTPIGQAGAIEVHKLPDEAKKTVALYQILSSLIDEADKRLAATFDMRVDSYAAVPTMREPEPPAPTKRGARPSKKADPK